jgi:hypothetical protein
MTLLAGLSAQPWSAHAARPAAGGGGDIPDSAVYLTYTAPAYHIKYVEGWGRQTHGATVTFADKDSIEQVTLQPLPHGTLSDFVRDHEVPARRHAGARSMRGPQALTLPAGNGWYLQYVISSAPDPVTGKVVPLLVNQYYLSGHGRLAILTLASPVTDDNVDAFHLIARSFGWR